MPLVQNVGRFEINRGNHMLVDSNTAVIQITDIDTDFPTLKGSPADIIQLKFLDVESSDIQWPSMTINGLVSRAEAKAIADFIIESKALGRNILVNCEMGVSRSGAVARAAIEYGYFPHPACVSSNPNMTLLGYLRSELGTAFNPDISPFNNMEYEDTDSGL